MSVISRLIPGRIKRKLVKEIRVYDATKPYEIKINASKPLTGRTAVVTGGSGAIGRAICFRLAAEGALVYVSGRTESTVMKVVNEIRASGLNAEPFILDVSDSGSIDKAFDTYFANNCLDILVNCAGGGAREKMNSLAEQSVQVIDDILDSNLRGTMLCTRKAAQLMIPNNAGKIVINMIMINALKQKQKMIILFIVRITP